MRFNEPTRDPTPDVDVADVSPEPHGTAASKETLADYTPPFTPRHYRKWSTGTAGWPGLGTDKVRDHVLPAQPAVR